MKIVYRLLFTTTIILIVVGLQSIEPSPQLEVLDLPEQAREIGKSPILTKKEVGSSNLFCDGNSIKVNKPIENIPSLNKDGWKLVWHDEFDQACLDSTMWNAEEGALEKNNELQFYSPTNIVVEDDLLKLVSKKEKYRNRDFTSAAVHTLKKFEFLYGRVEMRAKVPAGQGIFPAFWMMTNNEQTWLPEIDIMEMLGHKPDEIWMVSHWLGEDGHLKSESNFFKGQDFSQDFHTFSIEWTQDSLTWFIDDIERFKTKTNIPNEKMYLYLNTAVGGNWPGPPDETTEFPVLFEIDYVRVYQRN